MGEQNSFMERRLAEVVSGVDVNTSVQQHRRNACAPTISPVAGCDVEDSLAFCVAEGGICTIFEQELNEDLLAFQNGELECSFSGGVLRVDGDIVVDEGGDKGEIAGWWGLVKCYMEGGLACRVLAGEELGGDFREEEVGEQRVTLGGGPVEGGGAIWPVEDGKFVEPGREEGGEAAIGAEEGVDGGGVRGWVREELGDYEEEFVGKVEDMHRGACFGRRCR